MVLKIPECMCDFMRGFPRKPTEPLLMPPYDLLAVAAQTRYPLEAFLFVQRGLDYTVRHEHGEIAEDRELEPQEMEERHVDGAALCWGLADFARQQYGLMARTVLKRWQIYACEDFGRIVFSMVDAGLMHTTDEDTLDDFIDVYDFADAFSHSLELTENNI